MNTYMHACTHTHTHMHTYMHAHIHTHTHMHTCMHAHIMSLGEGSLTPAMMWVKA